jgi:hypothetical protein
LIFRLLDKLIFGATLMLSLQIPQLADHYQQYLTGLYNETKWQVEGYESTARMYEFPDVRSMINLHLKNSERSVRTDAEQKLATLERYEDYEKGVMLFETGTLLKKVLYIFNPNRYQVLKDTLKNFKVGIPLTYSGLTFGVLMGLILNLIMTLPFNWWWSRRKKA